jgi:transcriptional regulator with XRE-family HTH domain
MPRREQQQEKRRRTPRTALIDRHIGARIRERRILLGLTHERLADLIGVTMQQAQKYQRGATSVSAGGLYRIAQALRVAPEYFFEGLEAEAPPPPPLAARERLRQDTVRHVGGIGNPKVQALFGDLVRALAEPSAAPSRRQHRLQETRSAESPRQPETKRPDTGERAGAESFSLHQRRMT